MKARRYFVEKVINPSSPYVRWAVIDRKHKLWAVTFRSTRRQAREYARRKNGGEVIIF